MGNFLKVHRRVVKSCLMPLLVAVLSVACLSNLMASAAAPGIVVRVAKIRASDDNCFITFGVINNWDQKLTTSTFDVTLFDKSDVLLGTELVNLARTGKVGVEQFSFISTNYGCPIDDIGKIRLEWKNYTKIDGEMIQFLDDQDAILNALTGITFINLKTPVAWSKFDGTEAQEIPTTLDMPGCANC